MLSALSKRALMKVHKNGLGGKRVLCGTKLGSGARFSRSVVREWKEVTCKACLKRRGKDGSQGD